MTNRAPAVYAVSSNISPPSRRAMLRAVISSSMFHATIINARYMPFFPSFFIFIRFSNAKLRKISLSTKAF